MKKSELMKNTGTPGKETTAKPAATMPRATSAKPGSTGTAGGAVSEKEPQPSNGANEQDGSSLKAAPSLLEAIGTQIVATHVAANGAFVEVLVSATKCGLLLLAAKDVVKPGFEAWFEEMKFPFTKVTRCKYMRLADRLCEEGQSKPCLLLSMQPATNGLPASFTFDEQRLRTIITSVSNGRSLSELYFDWDIVKKSQNKKPDGPATRLGAGEGESPEEVRRHWSKVMDGLPFIFARLQPEVQIALLTDLEGLLAKLKTIQQTPSTEN